MRLTDKIEVLVPTIQQNGQAVNKEDREQALHAIKQVFQNYTTTEVVGGWILESGTLQEENNTSVYTYTTEESFDALLENTIAWAKITRNKLNQEAVAIITKNGMVFI